MTVSVLLERTDDVLEKLYQLLPNPNPTLLFESTELQAYAEQSPIWLEPPSSTSITALMRDNPSAWPGLIIESHATNKELLGHLRGILFVQFDTERRGVLRYFSPTTASYFFTVEDETTARIWMGPILRLSWYGGTWFDLAEGKLRWLNAQGAQASDWKAPHEPKAIHLDTPHEQALQQQQKEHFAYQWWNRQCDISLSDTSRFLNEGMTDGFVEAEELNEYLSLRAQHPFVEPAKTPAACCSEERLELLRHFFKSSSKDKESLT